MKTPQNAQNRGISGKPRAGIDLRLGNGQKPAGPLKKSPPLTLPEILRFSSPQVTQPERLSLPDPDGGFFFQLDLARQVYALSKGKHLFFYLALLYPPRNFF
jgi:hypothetical protein